MISKLKFILLLGFCLVFIQSAEIPAKTEASEKKEIAKLNASNATMATPEINNSSLPSIRPYSIFQVPPLNKPQKYNNKSEVYAQEAILKVNQTLKEIESKLEWWDRYLQPFDTTRFENLKERYENLKSEYEKKHQNLTIIAGQKGFIVLQLKGELEESRKKIDEAIEKVEKAEENFCEIESKYDDALHAKDLEENKVKLLDLDYGKRIVDIGREFHDVKGDLE